MIQSISEWLSDRLAGPSYDDPSMDEEYEPVAQIFILTVPDIHGHQAVLCGSDDLGDLQNFADTLPLPEDWYVSSAWVDTSSVDNQGFEQMEFTCFAASPRELGLPDTPIYHITELPWVYDEPSDDFDV